MSEYKWSDPDPWDTFCYVKKGEEKLGFFQTYLELEALERQIKEVKEEIESYKYDLETLVSVVSECLNKMSSEECYDTLQQVVNHYDELKEQG